jgi:hypothetical protein
MKREPPPRRAPLVSSWGALAIAVFSATTVFLLALSMVAYVRRDDVAPREDPTVSVVIDTGRVDNETHHETPTLTADGGVFVRASADAGSSAPTRIHGTHQTDASRAQAEVRADAGENDAVPLDVAALVVAHLTPFTAALKGCVVDARRRDPSTDDNITVTISIGRDSSVRAVTVARSPSPFATRCLADTVAHGTPGVEPRVDVEVSTRGATLTIVRVGPIYTP